jgi:hypothetical protein
VALLGNQFVPPETYRWLDEHCTLERVFGPYIFYHVNGTYPRDRELLIPRVTPRPEFRRAPE